MGLRIRFTLTGLIFAAVLAFASAGAQGQEPGEPQGRTVRGVLLDRDYGPLPGVSVSIRAPLRPRGGDIAPRPVPSTVRATTEAQGLFRGENAPLGSLTMYIPLDREEHVGRSAGKDFPEDRDFHAVMIDLSSGQRPTRTAAPPVRASEWIAGEPPADFDGLVRFLYLVPLERRDDHAAVLAEFHHMAQRYAGRQFAAVVVYPPDASPDAIRAELPEGMAALVAVDQAVEPGLDIGWTRAYAMAKTTRDARFLLTDRAGVGALVLDRQAWHPNYAGPWQVERLLDAVDVELAVVCPEGRPVPRAFLISNTHGFGAYRWAEPDGEGRISLRALRPRHRLATSFFIGVCLPERGLYGQTGLEMGGGEETRQTTVRLAPQPPVSGRVVSADGTPLPDASIKPQAIRFSLADGRRISLPADYAPRTDADGEFRFEWIPPHADGRLDVSAAGYHGETLQFAPAPEDAPDQTRRLPDAVLHRTVQEAQFVVVDMDGQPAPRARVSAAGHSAVTDVQGVATIAGMPDKPVRVEVSGNYYARTERGPGRHVLVAFSREQRQQYEALFQGGDGPPLWRVGRWISGEPVPFGAPAPWLVLVPSDGLGQDVLLRLAELAGRWHQEHGARLPRIALVLPVGIGDEEAAAVAQRAWGVSVGVDLPVPAAPEVGYSQLVQSVVRPNDVFSAYLQLPWANPMRLRGLESLDDAFDAAGRNLWNEVRHIEEGAKAHAVSVHLPDGTPAEGVRVVSRSGNRWFQGWRAADGSAMAYSSERSPLTALLAWREDDDLVGLSEWAPGEAGDAIAVRLQQGAALRGRAVDADGQPVVGLQMRLRAAQGALADFRAPDTLPNAFGVAATGPDGQFEFRAVPPGMDWNVEADTGQMSWASRVAVPPEGGADAEGVLVRPTDRTVRGLVLDYARNPFAGSMIQVASLHRLPRTTVSDGQGRFAIENAPLSGLTVSAFASVPGEDRRASSHRSFPEGEGECFGLFVLAHQEERTRLGTVAVPLSVGEWVGGEPPDAWDKNLVRYVYYVERKRHPDHTQILRAMDDLARRNSKRRFVAVVIYPVGTGPDAIRAEMPEGFSGLVGVDKEAEPGTGAGWTEAIRVVHRHNQRPLVLSDRGGTVHHAVWESQNWQEGFGAEFEEWHLEPLLNAVDVRLAVLDPEGRPVAGARFGASIRRTMGEIQEAVTDEEGCVALSALPFLERELPLVLVVHHEERGLAAWVEHDGDAGAEAEEIAVRLGRLPPVVGRVVDSEGKPLADVEVVPSILSGRGRQRMMGMPSITTGADGAFRFDWIAPTVGGNVSLRSGQFFDDRVELAPAEAGADSRDLGDIVLHPADRESTFKVVDAEGKVLEGVQVMVGERGRRGLHTNAQGEAKITGLPDLVLPVNLRGAGLSGRLVARLGPGSHVLAAVTRQQRTRLLASFRLQDGLPLWRAERWIQGEPVPFDLAPSWVVVAPHSDLGQDGRLRLAEQVAQWRREHAARVPRFAIVLPAGIADEEAAAVAERAEGVSVGVDQPVVPDSLTGYTQAVMNTYVESVAFLSFLHIPPGGRNPIVMVSARGDLDVGIPRLDELLREAVGKMPLPPKEQVAAMRESGELVSEHEDPFAYGRIWMVLRQGLATMAEGELMQRWDAVLGMEGFRVSGLAFAENTVYAGTDQGLVAYSRETGTWNRIAPAGDYDLIAAPVEKLETQGGRIEAIFSPEGEAARVYVLEQDVWRKGEGNQ